MSTHTRRLVAVVSGGLLAAAVITGCGDSDDSTSADGGSSGGDYCDQVEEMQGEFAQMGDAELTLNDVSDTVDLVGDIGDSAPDDIASSWEALHSAMGGFESGLADLGIDGDAPMQAQFEKLAKEDPAKQKEILGAMSSMQDVQSDAEKIEKQVKTECDIDLSENADEPDSAEDGS